MFDSPLSSKHITTQEISIDQEGEKIRIRRMLTQSRESLRKRGSRPCSVINQTDLDNAVLYAKCRRRRQLYKNVKSGSNWTGHQDKWSNLGRSVSNYRAKRIKPFMNIKDIDTGMVASRAARLKRKNRSESLIPVKFHNETNQKTYYVTPALGESIKWY